MKQSKRRINILGVKENYYIQNKRGSKTYSTIHICVCYDNRRYSVMTTNGESGRGNNRKLTNDRMTGEIM